MTEAKSERTYSDDEIQQRLKRDLPHWYLENGWIRRKYRTNSWKGTLMVINTVGHLAEAAWHHPDITASYAWVEVRLQNHAAKGITDKDFELAKKIEDVVHWQPGKEGARSKVRRRKISVSPTSNMTTDRRFAVSFAFDGEPRRWSARGSYQRADDDVAVLRSRPRQANAIAIPARRIKRTRHDPTSTVAKTG